MATDQDCLVLLHGCFGMLPEPTRYCQVKVFLASCLKHLVGLLYWITERPFTAFALAMVNLHRSPPPISVVQHMITEQQATHSTIVFSNGFKQAGTPQLDPCRCLDIWRISEMLPCENPPTWTLRIRRHDMAIKVRPLRQICAGLHMAFIERKYSKGL